MPPNFPPLQTVYYHLRRFRLTALQNRVLEALRATTWALSVGTRAAIGGNRGHAEHQDSGGIGVHQRLRQPHAD